MWVKAGGANGSRRMGSPLRLAGLLSTRPGGKVARFNKIKKIKKGFVNDNCFLIIATNVRLFPPHNAEQLCHVRVFIRASTTTASVPSLYTPATII